LVLESICWQVDELVLYVNDGNVDGLQLDKYPNLTVVDGSRKLGNISARGKLMGAAGNDEGIYLCLDDDFIYPSDYIDWVKTWLGRLGRECVVGFHASILPSFPRWYFDRTFTQRAVDRGEAVEPVNLLGSATVAFRLEDLDVSPFLMREVTQVDLDISWGALEKGLPLFSLPRRQGWIQSIEHDGLWEMNKSRISHHSHEARVRDLSWSHIADVIRKWMERSSYTHEDLSGLGFSQEVSSSLLTNNPPRKWREDASAIRRRREYFNLLDSDDSK